MKEKTRLIHEKEAILFKEYQELRNKGFSKDSEECLDIQSKILELNWDFCLDKAQKSYKHLVASRGDEWKTAVTEIAIVIHLGMAEALPNYNPNYGVYFSSFAESYIKHAVEEFVQKDMNLKPYDADLTKKLERAKEIMIKKYGTDKRPISEYEKITGLSTARLIRAQTISNRANKVSIGADTFADAIGLTAEDADPEKTLEKSMQSETLLNALKELSPIQKQIISLHFGFGEDKEIKVRAIAKRLNMTEYEVQNELDSALMKIRENPEVRRYFNISAKEAFYTKEDFDVKYAL